MDDNLEQIKGILEYLINALEKDLEKSPFFLVTEHDLAAYLYSKLILRKDLQEPFCHYKNGKKQPNFRVHMEYPRYQIEDDKVKRKGRYDLVILRKENNTFGKPFEDDKFSMKPVWLGFETKLHWNVGEKAVGDGFLSEKMAFAKKDYRFERRPADYGVIFHLNGAKKKQCDLGLIVDKIKRFQEESEIKESKTFAVYMESYDEEGKEPNTVAILPDGTRFL